jgi:hypothetical protein
VIGQEEVLEQEGDEYIEPPNFDFDHGRDSPYRYVHGAPLHNVVEEEEEYLAVMGDGRSWCLVPSLKIQIIDIARSYFTKAYHILRT